VDAKLKEIINGLDEKRPRSLLAPYRELILELRRRNRTYREIMQILADRCQVRISISTLHDFLHAQRQMGSKPRKQKSKKHNSPHPKEQLQETAKYREENPSMNDIRQRIAALKQKPKAPSQANTPRFTYDPNQPLHLTQKSKKSGGQD
jgi:IS30 family transposase